MNGEGKVMWRMIQRMGKGVGTQAGHKRSGDEGKGRKSRNTTPLLGLKTTRLHV